MAAPKWEETTEIPSWDDTEEIKSNIGQPLPKAKEPSFFSQALPFASRQISRISDAPLRGAATEVLDKNRRRDILHLPLIGKDVLYGAAKGFTDPEGTPSGQNVAKRLGVPDRDISMRAPQMSGMGFSEPQYVTFNPSQVVGVAGEAASPVPLGPVLKLGAKTAGLAAKSTNSLAATIANTTDEAMALMSTKAGRLEAKAIDGKLLEVGEGLVKAVKNAPSMIKEGEEVAKILPRMGNVDISKTIKVLEDAKPKPNPAGNLAPGQKIVADAIDAQIASLKNQKTGFFKTKYTAQEAVEFRRALDDVIDYDMPGASEVENALFKARTQLKNDLIDAANKTGNVGYGKLMASWSDKLETANSLRRRIGVSSKKTDAELGQQLLSSLFGKNKEQAQEILADFDKTFGHDFSRKAKVAQLVSEFNPAMKRTVTGDIQGRLGKAMEKYVDPITKAASQYGVVPATRGLGRGFERASTYVDDRVWPGLMAQLAREAGRE